MLNIGDGRQPRILVDNFLIPRSKHVLHSRVSRGRICEDNIDDHKRKVDTNRLVSETHQMWKDLLLLDSSNVHLQYEKKNQRNKANFSCKWYSLLIEHG